MDYGMVMIADRAISYQEKDRGWPVVQLSKDDFEFLIDCLNNEQAANKKLKKEQVILQGKFERCSDHLDQLTALFEARVAQAMGEKDEEPKWQCPLCEKDFINKHTLRAHNNSAGHLQREARRALRNDKVPGCEWCKQDAHVCTGHCTACAQTIKKFNERCGLHK
jgi:hypothetical protein